MLVCGCEMISLRRGLSFQGSVVKYDGWADGYDGWDNEPIWYSENLGQSQRDADAYKRGIGHVK